MTIGEKIVHLRISYDISQMQLAKLLKVSRQSISKWESGENIPQVDKIAELCNLSFLSIGNINCFLYNFIYFKSSKKNITDPPFSINILFNQTKKKDHLRSFLLCIIL